MMMAEAESLERSQGGEQQGGGNVAEGVSEILYKVLVVGNFGVGKTSIIRRYTSGTFSPNYKLTIGVDFALKTLEWDDRSRINMQLWDIAGHERFGHMTRVYYKYAIAAIIVFDLTRFPTFESVSKWLSDVRQKVVLENEEPVPVVLLANKSDLLESAQVDTKQIQKFCDDNNLIGWFLTSAKDNVNIDEAMNFLVTKIMEVSAKQGNVLRSPSTVDFEAIDGHTVDLDSKNLTPDGNVPNGKTPTKKKNDCCV